MLDLLPPIEIDPVRPPRASVIWLHGLGASGHDFEPLVPELGLVDSLDIRFVLPHAPSRPVTLNGGYVMPAWYDITSLDFGAGEDRDGILEAEATVRRLMERQRDRGVAPDRLILAGFSQGGAVALYTGLRYPEPVAGILALSTYLPLADELAKNRDGLQLASPIFMAHGDRDEIVAPRYAEAARDRLQAMGCQVQWHSYTMGHSVVPEEVADIRTWLAQRLA